MFRKRAWLSKMLNGVKIYEVKKILDERGLFTELYREDWKEFTDSEQIVQVNFSISFPVNGQNEGDGLARKF